MGGPLTGVKVFDMTTAAAGPFATMELALLGADVIKVEPPHGDVLLSVPPKQRGLSCVYSSSNLAKRSIVLDMSQPEDQKLAYDLIARADVFVENARNDAKVEALGMGFERLVEINPTLVYASSRAWGHQGPMKDQGGAAPAVEAFSGCASVTGARHGRAEFTRLAGLLDFTTSSYFAVAILDALVTRQRTAKAVRVRTSMLASAISLQITRLAEYFATGSLPERLGAAASTSAPHAAFECQDHKWLCIGVLTDEHWRALCTALGRSDLAADERFGTNPERVLHRDELSELIEAVFKSKPAIWWITELRKFGVPNATLFDFVTLRENDQVLQNAYIVPIDVPHQGRVFFGGLPWHFAATPAHLSPPPFPGQHSDEVRGEFGLAPRGAITSERERSGSF